MRTHSDMELIVAMILIQLAVVVGVMSHILGFLRILDTVDWPAVLFAGTGWALGWVGFLLLMFILHDHLHNRLLSGVVR